MKSNVLAICDEQVVYSDFLTKQLLRMEDRVFHICKFSSLEQLLIFNREHKIQYLLISELFKEQIQEMDEVQAKQYFYLTSERRKVKENDEEEKKPMQYIYRYQSVEEIYEKLIENLWLERPEELALASGMEVATTKLIGIYNPVHRNGQTTFAKSLANFYGKRGRRVLYLNMEEYAGITVSNMGKEGDLGEVLYYLKQDIQNINYHLATFTCKVQNYEMVPPILVSKELRDITLEEWMSFLLAIGERSGYEVVILDLDSCVQGLLDILERCDLIYMPILEASGGEDKIEQFMMNLEKLQKEGLQQRIIPKQISYLRNLGKAEVEKEVEVQVGNMFA